MRFFFCFFLNCSTSISIRTTCYWPIWSFPSRHLRLIASADSKPILSWFRKSTRLLRHHLCVPEGKFASTSAHRVRNSRPRRRWVEEYRSYGHRPASEPFPDQEPLKCRPLKAELLPLNSLDWPLQRLRCFRQLLPQRPPAVPWRDRPWNFNWSIKAEPCMPSLCLPLLRMKSRQPRALQQQLANPATAFVRINPILRQV